jgi:hypothetical protein
MYNVISPKQTLLLSRYIYSVKDIQITGRFLPQICGCAPTFKMVERIKNLLMDHGVLLKVGFNHSVSISSHFLDFCTEFDTHVDPYPWT